MYEVPDHLTQYVQEQIAINTDAAIRKSMWATILNLTPYRDGNQWCVLWGEDIASGICGFGDSPVNAMADFDKAMQKSLRTLPTQKKVAVEGEQ